MAEADVNAPVPPELEPYHQLIELFVRGLRNGWESVPDQEIDSQSMRAGAAQRLRSLPPESRFGTLHRVLEYEHDAIAGHVSVLWQDTSGERWRAGFHYTPDPPHLIRMYSVRSQRPLPDGFSVRLATAADGPALRRLEHRCPIQIGDAQVTYDHGYDYFAGSRLMGGDASAVVLEHERNIVGVACRVTVPVRIGGQDYRAGYSYRMRIDPGYRGQGLSGAFSALSRDRFPGNMDFGMAYIARGNASAERLLLRPWSVEPQRALVATTLVAGGRPTHRCTPADANRIVALLNVTHGTQELFVPYTTESFAARVEREPSLYSWSDVLMSKRAVMGVAAAPMKVIRSSASGRSENTRALVFDYGFEIGAEEEFVDLLRAACSGLAANEVEELSIFTSPGSPAHDQLVLLASRIEQYKAEIFMSEPPGVADRGVYVDQLYF